MLLNMRMVAAVVAGLALCGCATTAENAKPKPAVAGVSRNPNCLTETGSRITAGKPDCMAVGRAYSSTDIQSTGATTAADALGKLDPSITVHR
jgi:hypothetical protein